MAMLLREKNTYVPETVRQLVLEVLHTHRFGTVREVVNALEATGVPQKVTLSMIRDLAREGKVILHPPGASRETVMAPVGSLSQYLASTLAFDLWVTLLLWGVGLATTFLIPSSMFPLVIVRWVFSGLLLVFVPGFALVRLLFPFDRFIDRWERIALSLGLSIALSVLVAFGLNFTPWGITPLSVATGLSIISIALITGATYRRARVLISPKKTEMESNLERG